MNASFIGIRAECRSMECGIGEGFVSLMRTRSPCFTRITGPGTVPPKVHPSYFTPGEISIVSCVIGIVNSLMRAEETGFTEASTPARRPYSRR